MDQLVHLRDPGLHVIGPKDRHRHLDGVEDVAHTEGAVKEIVRGLALGPVGEGADHTQVDGVGAFLQIGGADEGALEVALRLHHQLAVGGHDGILVVHMQADLATDPVEVGFPLIAAESDRKGIGAYGTAKDGDDREGIGGYLGNGVAVTVYGIR